MVSCERKARKAALARGDTLILAFSHEGLTTRHFSQPSLIRLGTAANRRRGAPLQTEVEHVNAQPEQRGARRPRPAARNLFHRLVRAERRGSQARIHAYASAIASHRRLARSGFHTRLSSHSHPPLFKSLNISSIHMRIPYPPPSDSGQLVTKNHGSARSQSRARSAQRLYPARLLERPRPAAPRRPRRVRQLVERRYFAVFHHRPNFLRHPHQAEHPQAHDLIDKTGRVADSPVGNHYRLSVVVQVVHGVPNPSEHLGY